MSYCDVCVCLRIVVSNILSLLPYCDIRYEFRIKTRFGSSLPLVFWLKDVVVFVICVCLCIVMSNIS